MFKETEKSRNDMSRVEVENFIPVKKIDGSVPTSNIFHLKKASTCNGRNVVKMTIKTW